MKDENKLNDFKNEAATRSGFGRGLVKAAKENPKIIALAADLKDSVGFGEFAKEFPERFVETGIAEQNLATVASGMAHVGYIPFAASYAAFNPGRNYEQIRTTIALNNQPVKIIGSHAGLNVGADGATHQMLEDISLMRVLPRMIVIAPGDAIEAEKVAQIIAKNNQPTYVRLAREKSPIFFDQNHEFEIGKAYILREGNDITLFGTGTMTAQNLLAAEILARENISAEVVHVPTIKPLDENIILKSAAKTKRIITVEEHQIAGGFGSAIAEILLENLPKLDIKNFKFIGVNDKFGQSGTADELLKYYGLTAKNIAKNARNIITNTDHSNDIIVADKITGEKMNQQEKLEKMHNARGFIAALDQSGGSTPKALNAYGIDSTKYNNENEMFALVHKMRTRIISSSAFSSENILGAILFEKTLDGKINNISTAQYLLNKGILPFLKIDSGLDEMKNNVQLMKPILRFDELLKKAVENQVFGTKMRSVIFGANEIGIREIVAQQFDFARKIIAENLIPIVEPEVDINIPDKAEAEKILLSELKIALSKLPNDQKVILKLSLPSENNFYEELLKLPQILRIVALSGGYSREIACEKLAQNHGIIASFSRALLDGLSANQTDEEFNETLQKSINEIVTASNT